MCGRYNIETNASALLLAYQLMWQEIREQKNITNYNVSPTQHVPVITENESGRHLTFMRWGLIPSWNKVLKPKITPINARSDTLAEKPMFRGLIRHKRCILPASGFYEWLRQGSNKQPFNFRRIDKQQFGMAGLWDLYTAPDGSEVSSCTIITTNANDLMKPIHDRMPVILQPNDYGVWLNPRNQDKAGILALLKPYAANDMEAYLVDKAVNNARNNGPELLKAV